MLFHTRDISECYIIQLYVFIKIYDDLVPCLCLGPGATYYAVASSMRGLFLHYPGNGARDHTQHTQDAKMMPKHLPLLIAFPLPTDVLFPWALLKLHCTSNVCLLHCVPGTQTLKWPYLQCQHYSHSSVYYIKWSYFIYNANTRAILLFDFISKCQSSSYKWSDYLQMPIF